MANSVHGRKSADRESFCACRRRSERRSGCSTFSNSFMIDGISIVSKRLSESFGFSLRRLLRACSVGEEGVLALLFPLALDVEGWLLGVRVLRGVAGGWESSESLVTEESSDSLVIGA